MKRSGPERVAAACYSLSRLDERRGELVRLAVTAVMLLCLLLSLVSLSCGAPSQGCGKERPSQPHPGHHHRYQISLTDPGLGEITREYALHLPAHYDVSNNVAVPLLLDYHGWTGNAHDQMVHMPWRDVADLDQPGFIYVTMQGMNDVLGGGSYSSWNVSKSSGPLGPVCNPSLHQDYPCMEIYYRK